jgi:DNA-binding protein HU-beta
MDKTEIAKIVSTRTGIGMKDVLKIVNETIIVIADAMERDERVTLMGFGSFKVLRYPEQHFVHPKKKTPYTKPPRAMPRFTVSKNLKARIQKKLALPAPDPSGPT